MASLGLMVSGLSHEINNSINFISSSLPILKKKLHVAFSPAIEDSQVYEKTSADIERILKNMYEGVDRTMAIINDLSIFSHDKGLEFEMFDILPGLEASIAIAERQYKNNIDFIIDIDQNLPMISGHAGQINQVFMNLLVNAAQAIHTADGKIKVAAKQQGGNVIVVISDNGCGMTPGQVKKIYDPFYTTKDVGQGTGLGLSICYSIIEKHGGKIQVDSIKDKGATFTIIFPKSDTNV